VSDKNTAPVPRGQSYVVTDLGTLGGSLGSSAEAINSSGQVVGRSFTPDNATYHATLFSGTGSNNIDLGNFSDSPDNNISEAQGINDSGGIIGVSAAPPLRAALFSGTGSGNIDLGALNDSPLDSAAYAINNAGEIVGFAEGAGNGHATLFSGTGSNNIDLGTLGGATRTAYAVNNSSQIVGKAATAQQADRATLFGGTNFDLGTLGGFNSSAYGINDAGQIVGWGIRDGASRAFRLDPGQPYSAVIQQPINADGSSVFNGSRGVIPVKFKLMGLCAGNSTLVARIFLAKITNAVLGTEVEATSTSAADTGNTFRYDATSGTVIVHGDSWR